MKIASFGKIMLRLSTPFRERFQQSNSFEISFAGSEANVAVNLAHWGKQTIFISALPDNEIGEKVLQDINRFKVDSCLIKQSSKGRLGIIFLEKGATQLGSKVTYDRSYTAFVQKTFSEDFYSKAFTGCNWFHWTGITTGLGENSI